MVVLFAGFAGSGPMDESRILMIGNCVNDTLAPLFRLHSLPEEETEAKASIHVVDKILFVACYSLLSSRLFVLNWRNKMFLNMNDGVIIKTKPT